MIHNKFKEEKTYFQKSFSILFLIDELLELTNYLKRPLNVFLKLHLFNMHAYPVCVC